MKSNMDVLNSLSSIIQGVDSNSFASDDERLRAEELLMNALAKVRSPWDTAWNDGWVAIATNAAVKTLIDAGVFKKWVEAGSKPETSAELARLTNTDPRLIRRLMRHLAAQHLVIETEKDTYKPTAWAITLGTDPAFPAVYGTMYFDITAKIFSGMPSFLKETGFSNPTDTERCVIQHLQGPDASFFNYIGADPVRVKEFSDAMECHSKWNMTAWTSVFPTDTILKDAKPGRPLVVDIGGSKGHDLEKFRLKHPQIPDGSLVLEDLPETLEGVELTNKAIRKQPYNFFTPEPVKGARVYFLHKVLHDWPDATATKILKNVASAMEKGYSRILIHETLVENEKPSLRTTTSDLVMLSCLAAAERTVEEWHEVVNAAGLKIVNIWKLPTAPDGVIEVDFA